MNKTLSTLHRWLGFPLGLLFVITFGTGCLTAVAELLARFEYRQSHASLSYRSSTIEENAAALAIIVDGKKGIRQVLMPSPESPYYQVVARGERWVYPVDNIDQEHHLQRSNEGFFRSVLQLHRNFLLGKEGFLGIEGKYYTAWVGLGAVLLSFIGLWVWWPWRKTFKAKDILPRGITKKHFYYSHIASGVVVSVVILVLALTGASITYRAIAQQLFSLERNSTPALQVLPLNNNWLAWLEGAYAQMPVGSRLDKIRFPRQTKGAGEKRLIGNDMGGKTKSHEIKGNTLANNIPVKLSVNIDRSRQAENINSGKNIDQKLLEFRFYAPGNWLGLSSSKVKVDKQRSQLVAVILFSDLPFAAKIYSMLVPLHTGHNLSLVYVIALLVVSLLGTVMVFSGLVSFLVKRRQRPEMKRLLSSKTAVEA